MDNNIQYLFGIYQMNLDGLIELDTGKSTLIAPVIDKNSFFFHQQITE